MDIEEIKKKLQEPYTTKEQILKQIDNYNLSTEQKLLGVLKGLDNHAIKILEITNAKEGNFTNEDYVTQTIISAFYEVYNNLQKEYGINVDELIKRGGINEHNKSN